MMKNYLILLAFSFFALFSVSACTLGKSEKPTMTLVDDNTVKFNGKNVKIGSLAKTLREYRMELDSAIRDSIEIQFELYQGINTQALQRVKTEIQNAGIRNLKFVAPFEQ
jgi:hypothetical protein